MIRGWFWDQFRRGLKPAEETKGYRLIEYLGVSVPSATSNNRNLEKFIDADGDHLTIATVRGGAPVYVRVGPDPNPFIRVREGMVITRPFQGVTFRIGNLIANEAGQGRIAARVLAYVSHGPLVKFPPKEYGFKRVPLTRYGLTATTGVQALEAFVFGGSAPTLGLMGGTLIIKNTDNANTLYVVGQVSNMTALGSGSNGFPLYPGEALTLQLEQPLGGDATGLVDNGGLSFKTLAGTCEFALLGSSLELDDAQGDQLAEHIPSMR